MVTFYLFAVSFLYLAVSSQAAFSQCAPADAVGELTDLAITNCNVRGDDRCIFKRKTKGSITLSFKALEDIDNVEVKVHGIILDVPMPFPLPNPDGCKDSGLKCPLSKDGVYSYINVLPVDKTYPRVIVDVKYELLTKKEDGTQKTIACVIIPSKVM